MSWLRIDDGMDGHPKILALGSDERRFTWVRILIYTCRYKSAFLPENIRESVPKATPSFLRRCVEVGLLDCTDDGLAVHDWAGYQAGDPKRAQRQAKWRDKPVSDALVDAPVDGVVDVSVDGRVDGRVDAPVDGHVDGVVDGVVDASRAGARPYPVPSRKELKAIAASPPATRQQRAVKKANPPDHDKVIGCLSALFGEPTNDAAWGRRHKDAKHIHQSLIATGLPVDAWEDEARRRANILRERWGGRAAVNPKSLADHWASCDLVDEPYPAWVDGLPDELAAAVREFPARLVWRDRPGFLRAETIELVSADLVRARLGEVAA